MKIDEPANIYALYVSNITASHRCGAQRRTYVDQVSEDLFPDWKVTAAEIVAYAVKKPNRDQLVAVPHKPDR